MLSVLRERIEAEVLRENEAEVERRFQERTSGMGVTEDRIFRTARDLAQMFPDKRIQAIKIVRNAFGLGLKEAKDVVDAVYGFAPLDIQKAYDSWLDGSSRPW